MTADYALIQAVLTTSHSVSPRRRYIMFSTRNPPAVQRMPWPSIDDDDSDDEVEPQRRSMTGHETWILNDQDLPWLEDANGEELSKTISNGILISIGKVAVEHMSYSRSTGVETWITTDGRVYFVQLQEVTYESSDKTGSATSEEYSQVSFTASDDVCCRLVKQGGRDSESSTLQWQGICVHDIETPKWMQKQKATIIVDDEEQLSSLEESRRAVRVAVNSKFSVVAIGMRRYAPIGVAAESSCV